MLRPGRRLRGLYTRNDGARRRAWKIRRRIGARHRRTQGLIHYTIGQRRGLGLSLREPLYVRAKNAADNTVALCPESGLYSKTLTASRANFITAEKLNRPARVRAKIRYRAPERPATVEQLSEDKIRIEFDEPQRAITPGQSVVLYDGDYVVGGGVID